MTAETFITGEYRRKLDERFRLTLPEELAAAISDEGGQAILTKERAGCLSLWNAAGAEERQRESLELLQHRIRANRLQQRWDDVQRLGRLLSTRSRNVELKNRSRLLLPEGFREFLDVAPGSEVMIVGAAVCVEIWNPQSWLEMLRAEMPDFNPLLRELAQ